MSYNNGSVMTNARRRQGPALSQSMGRAGTGTRMGVSGETAEVEANDAGSGAAELVALLRVARDEQQRPRVTPMALFGECPAELSFADFCTALVQIKAAGKVGYSEHHVWLTEKGGGL